MTPDNGQYAVIAYVLATIIFLGYAVSLVFRERGLRARLDATSPRELSPRA